MVLFNNYTTISTTCPSRWLLHRDVHPFEIYDARIGHIYCTIELLLGFHQKNGYHNFVINYVVESPESLPELLNLLHPLDSSIFTYLLTCEKEEQAKRIQKEAAQHGFIEKEVDTTRLTSEEVAEAIWKDVFISQAAEHSVHLRITLPKSASKNNKILRSLPSHPC